jgi:uncharacterized protein YcbX
MSVKNGEGAAGQLTVTALFRYPIKSCAGTSLEEVTTDARGFVHDRELMVVDRDGEFLTQRELPRMALIRPTIGDGSLRMEAPGMPTLDVALVREGRTRDVVVWRDTCRAVDQGDEVAGWLSDHLRYPCRLVRMADDHVRKVDRAYAKNDRDQVHFADGYPFLLISRESLDDLNTRLAEPLPMNRFRPNIVAAGGGAPYLEDGWRRIRIGEMVFHVVKACARCAITTTDQETTERGKEPLATLATYRKVERGVLFGQNLLHEANGTVRVGDEVAVLE